MFGREVYIVLTVTERRLGVAFLPLMTDAGTLQAIEVLVVAIGVAGLAILILFAKRKI